jgi:hypothetical protein
VPCVAAHLSAACRLWISDYGGNIVSMDLSTRKTTCFAGGKDEWRAIAVGPLKEGKPTLYSSDGSGLISCVHSGEASMMAP